MTLFGWRELARSWRQHFFTQLATLLVLTASLTVVTFFINISLNLKRVVTEWGDHIQMTIYLKDGLNFDEVANVGRALKKMGVFADVEYKSSQTALNTFSRQLATYAPDLLKDGNFADIFPASFEVTIKRQAQSLVDYDWLVAQAHSIHGISGVDDVSYGQGWVENYSHFVRGLSLMSVLLIAVLLTGALFVIGNAIRVSVMQRREEIEILELLGATSAAIRAPYLCEGLLTGAFAALLSLLVNYFLYLAQLKLLESSWSFMGLASHLSFFGLVESLALVTIGAAVGFGGAYLTILNLNTGWSASQRLISQ